MMLHTFYSNSYRVLKTLLRCNLTVQLEYPDDEISPELFFNLPQVIVPSAFVADDLKRDFASQIGIHFGLNVCSLGQWIRELTQIKGEGSNESEAIVWEILRAFENWSTRHPDEKRLSHYLSQNTDRRVRYDLATSIADVFRRYALYRTDWLIDWERAGNEAWEHIESATVREDARWQRMLWQEINETLQNQSGQPSGMDSLLATFGRLKDQYRKSLSSSTNNQPMHLFLPTFMPPLMLPFLSLLAQHRDVWIYVQNPCVVPDWFEPSHLLYDRKREDQADQQKIMNASEAYLYAHSRAQRAEVDRLRHFTNYGESLEVAVQEPVCDVMFSSAPQAKFIDCSALRLDERLKAQYTEFQELFSTKVLTQSQEDEWAVLPLGVENDAVLAGEASFSDTLLHRVQQSLLTLDDRLLPERIRHDDESVRLLRAPTPVREIEGIVDYLYELFKSNDEKGEVFKPEDVLVVTPNIADKAPIIDGVFSSLTDERKIPWRIAGQPVLSSNLAVQAVDGLGKLFLGRLTLSELMNWLELPLVSESFALKLEDIAVIRGWLGAAGFREGFDSEHLTVSAEEAAYRAEQDSTLSEAIDRLVLGFTLTDATVTLDKTLYAETLPVTVSPDDRFHPVSRHFRLLAVLLKLANAFRTGFESLYRENARTMNGWIDFTKALLTAFFGPDWNQKNELTEVRKVFRVMRAGSEELSQETMRFSFFWHVLERHLTDAKSQMPSQGGVTFTDMQTARFVDFKVIIMLGLDENCGFPGQSHAIEFDLMGIDRSLKTGLLAPRRGDRDSRADNRNVFLNLITSATHRVLLTYCEGSDANALCEGSVVIKDFLSFITARAEDRSKFEAALTWKMGLTISSRKNFGAQGFLQSHDAAELAALSHTQQSNAANTEACFYDCRPKVADETEVSLKSLLLFLLDHDRWSLNVLNIPSAWDGATQGDQLTEPADALSRAVRNREIFSRLRQGDPAGGIRELYKKEPLMGVQAWREKFMDAVGPVQDLFDVFKAQTQHAQAENECELTWQEPGTGLRITYDRQNIWRGLDGQRSMIAVPFSTSERLRAVLTYAFYKATGESVALTLISEKSDSNIIDFDGLNEDDALQFWQCVIGLYCRCRKNSWVPLFAQPDTLLWRGVDIGSELAITDAVKAKKELIEHLKLQSAPPDTKKWEQKWCKLLQNFSKCLAALEDWHCKRNLKQ